MELHITYETLFDLLRKERSLDELQPLPKTFWKEVVEYINDRQEKLATSSSIEQEKVKIQLQNIKRIIQEIYRRREQKIVRFCLNITRSKTKQYVDKRNMLRSEEEFFDEFTQLLEKYQQGVLEQIFIGQTPIIAPEILEPRKTVEKQEEQPTQETKKQQVETKTEKQPEQETSETSSSKPALEAKPGSIIIRFITNVPKFIGKNKEIFGPYSEGEIVQLPANIAQILLKKNKVEHVMANV